MDNAMQKELVNGILYAIQDDVLSIILYGSVVRGTETDESDVDIAILVKRTLDFAGEDKLSDVIVDLNLKYDKVFSVIDILIDDFEKWKKVTPFYQNITREGVVLWKAA